MEQQMQEPYGLGDMEGILKSAGCQPLPLSIEELLSLNLIVGHGYPHINL